MGINRITNYRFGPDDSGYIYRNWDISGDNVYFTEGEGCHTIWFSSVPEARRFINMKGDINGHDSGFCGVCSNNYAVCSEGYIKYPANACQAWKEEMKSDKKWRWSDTTGKYISRYEISNPAAAIFHKFPAKEMEALENILENFSCSGSIEVLGNDIRGIFKLRGNKICFYPERRRG